MVNEENRRHEMILSHVHDSGVEEWYCPTCGRRFLMQWPPNYQKIILEAGDEQASHSGGKGGLQMGGVEISADECADTADDPRLVQWDLWLEQIDFENLWDSD